MLVDGWIAHLRRSTKRDGGRLGRPVAWTEWTKFHAAAAQESAEPGELGGGVVCGAVP
jgi:hypothetical protein